jgi:molybdate transport system substrate-binding protein
MCRTLIRTIAHAAHGRLSARSYLRLVVPGVVAMLLSALSFGVQAQHEPLVAVAASVAAATEAITARFSSRSGIKVRLSVGASGNLARQIRRGAPFELFISADQSYPQGIVDAGLSAGLSTTYARGQLALMVTARSGIGLPTAIESAGAAPSTRGMAIRYALRDARIKHIAMANPNHAPYGRAARESLQFIDLWSSLEAKVVMGESVAQSARFATTGTVQVALLPLGTIVHSPLAKERYVIVPLAWYAPLRQQMVLIKAASAQARQLFAFVRTDEARAILAEYGFLIDHPPAGTR